MSEFSDVVEKIPGVLEVEAWLADEEKLVAAEFAPLVAQTVAAIKALGKATFQEGLQVFKDAATAAVQAGEAAALTGNPAAIVGAAEAAFLATGASEGITTIKNAEAGFIKAAVATAQSAVAVIATPVAPVTAA